MRKLHSFIGFYLIFFPAMSIHFSCMTTKPVLHDWKAKSGTGEKIRIIPPKPVPLINWFKIAGRPESAQFTGDVHHETVNGLSYSPDGKYIVSGSNDNTIKLWSGRGMLIRTFQKSKHHVSSVAFSPDSNYIISGSWDDNLYLWNLNGELIRTFKGHTSDIVSGVFSPDGGYILSGSRDRTAILWDIEGNPLHMLKGHTSVVSSVAFSPDGRYLLTGSSDKTAKLWSINGNLIRTYAGHRNIIESAVFSPDGRYIITGSNDWSIKIWDVNGSLVSTISNVPRGVRCLTISPDGRFIITGSTDKTVRVWSINGYQVRAVKLKTGWIETLAISPDGSQLAVGYYLGYVGRKPGAMSLINTIGRKEQFSSRFMLEDLLMYTPETGDRYEAERLNAQGLERHKRRYFDESERLFYLAAKKDSTWVKPFFNLACSASMRKKHHIALAYLEEALKRDAGKALVWAKRDPDIRFIRHLQEYRDLLKKYSH